MEEALRSFYVVGALTFGRLTLNHGDHIKMYCHLTYFFGWKIFKSIFNNVEFAKNKFVLMSYTFKISHIFLYFLEISLWV